LFSPGSEGGSSSTSYSSLRAPSASSESRGPPSGTNPGSSPWLERSAESEFGVPYTLRSLAAGGEGSSRLVSEVCIQFSLLFHFNTVVDVNFAKDCFFILYV
jgi:E3 ubiquitin-protein ligase Arkadia